VFVYSVAMLIRLSLLVPTLILMKMLMRINVNLIMRISMASLRILPMGLKLGLSSLTISNVSVLFFY
jgi:hypothetical protein